MADDTNSMSTSGWMKFFCAAGIPSVVSGNYAVLFTKHRMQMDMLSDLSMEILNAIGINVMGDIIAILKHAKELHTEVTREKALASEKDTSNSLLQSRANLIRRKKLVPTTATPDLQSQSKTTLPEKRTIINLKRKVSDEEVPVQKIRRVLPEHEGPYTIKMPMGATAKTRRLLAQQGLVAKKMSVFDRLGESKVSSTTGNGSEGPKITITSFGRSVVDSSTNSKVQNSSVFDRLGPGKSQVTSTSPDDDENILKDSSLPYCGVLKSGQNQLIKVTSKQGIRTAEATSTSRNLAQDKIDKKVSVLSRLGPNTIQTTQMKAVNKVLKMSTAPRIAIQKTLSTSSTSDGILATGMKAKKLSVLSRLGQRKNSDILEKKITTAPLQRIIKKKSFGDGSLASSEKTTVLLRKAILGGNVIKKVRIVKKPKIICKTMNESLDDDDI